MAYDGAVYHYRNGRYRRFPGNCNAFSQVLTVRESGIREKYSV